MKQFIKDTIAGIQMLGAPLVVIFICCMIPVAALLALIYGIIWIIKHFGIL